ncbi:hypothetical protein [Streptococcus mutans]|jgi:hypothetical protein|uniref:hypothetical protein n=1 Tax=Streptococcus mutans TaxID=1309 RepID=UPI0002B5E272|nr:hypothetical protein [Streptococcus mutans]EMB99187.1 hypothetical protein SMU68_09943 [Streptococcus mutans NFSM1]MCB4949595.1 hypothetical protein [Streptococcus mutans]MCB4960699.1 hypothetical protein [Streptococcus mutans]MCB5000273.1 hypothetical protein [Streptococcus mutans]MCB5078460.1 hypothetical protein [Streptococcus mutans]
MANKINVNSNYDTIYASKYTYDIESYAIKNNLDLETQSGQNVIKDAIRNKDIEFPSTSNLNMLTASEMLELEPVGRPLRIRKQEKMLYPTLEPILKLIWRRMF